jgi:hypothetical protein
MHSEVLTEQGLEIFPRLRAFRGFYLAGGTALALQIGHRILVDFDLFCDGLRWTPSFGQNFGRP